jgi:protein-disulfide isomerase
VFPEIRKSFIDTGKVRFVSRDLPLDFHANAMRAAMAARCAGDQGKYWEMREALVSGAGDLALASIRGHAQGVVPDMLAFDTCLSTEKHKAEVQRDVSDAASLQVTGTPTFVLGRTGADVIDGVRLVGAMPYAAMQSAIQHLLAPAGTNAGSR